MGIDAGTFGLPVSFSGYDTASVTRESTAALPGYSRLLSTREHWMYVARPCDGWKTSSCVADSSRSHRRLIHLPPGTAARRHTCSLPRVFAVGFLQALIADYPCLQLPFGSVSLGLDFVRNMCHSIPDGTSKQPGSPGTQQAAATDALSRAAEPRRSAWRD